MMKVNHSYDILIIGAGPIGLCCAIEAQKAKLSYIIIEKGCLVNSLYHYPSNMTFFSTSEKLEIGNIPFVSNNIKPTRAEALEYYRRVTEKFDLQLNLFEKVENVIGNQGAFQIKTSKDSYSAKHIIVSTGFYDIPNLMHVPGEDLPKVRHYYQDPHFYSQQNVLVVGANNSAVDAALETYRKGAHVSMVIREDEIGKRVKYWVRPDIVNRIKEGSVQAYFNSKIIQITEDSVELMTAEGSQIIKNDFVLAMTGYQPNFEFLRNLGINLSDDELRIPEHDPECMESNRKGIYLAGVVCGGMNTHSWFIENSRIHASQIIENIKSRQSNA